MDSFYKPEINSTTKGSRASVQTLSPLLSYISKTPLNLDESKLLDRVFGGEDIRLVNLDRIPELFTSIQKAFSYAQVYVAVKANSAFGVLSKIQTVAKENTRYEVATIEELIFCLKSGIKKENILFTHPAKDKIEIQKAFALGVSKFVSDNLEDLTLISKYAPGSKVLIRMTSQAHSNQEEVSLSNTYTFDERFGATPLEVKNLIMKSLEFGLYPMGICFHVGTQTQSPKLWKQPIFTAASLFRDMRQRGITLSVLDIGGGMPAQVHESIPSIEEFGSTIYGYLKSAFEIQNLPKIIIEPGRSLCALSGISIGRVINVKDHNLKPNYKNITLSLGKYSAGLYEVGYGYYFYRRLSSDKPLVPLKNSASHKATFYGKACSVIDYSHTGISIPANLTAGDLIAFTGTTAYCGEMTTNWCHKKAPTTLFISNGQVIKDTSKKSPIR